MWVKYIAILSAVVLTSCAVGPDFIAPEAPHTKRYTKLPLPSKTVTAPIQGGEAQHFYPGKDIPKEWWQLFQSKTLNCLIETGIANNPSIHAAQAAMRVAQENLRAQIGSAFYPAFNGQFSGSRQKFSGAAFGETTGSTSNIFNLFNTSVNMSYTLDIFGSARRQVEALCAQVHYQYYILEATYLNLAANIATTAISEASLAAQLAATHKLIKLEEALLNIIQKQFEVGAVASSDVLTQKSQLAQTRASLPPLEKNWALTRHALVALVGALPSENTLPRLSLAELQLPTALPLSVPSLLVRRRPDIRAAEALLQQASAQIGVATANLFPQITLTGAYGWEATSLSHFFQPSNTVWNITGQALAPLFQGGALLAKRRAALATYEQVDANYRQAVLQSFQNVADALRAIEVDAKALQAQVQAENASQSLLEVTQTQLKLGAVNYLSLLNAQRQYETALINRIQAQATRYSDTVALFQALGGAWWNNINEKS